MLKENFGELEVAKRVLKFLPSLGTNQKNLNIEVVIYRLENFCLLSYTDELTNRERIFFF